MSNQPVNSCSTKIVTIEPLLGDATARVLEVLKHAGEADVILRFTGETYHFWPERAYEGYYYISNNRHGLKRIAFPLLGRRNLTIDGGGARFVFHGEIVPFIVDGSQAVTLRNFHVDWERPFYSQGEVVEASSTSVVVKVDPLRYPHRVENQLVVFEGEGWESRLTEGVFAYDPKTRAPAFRSGDSMGLGFPETIRVEQVGEGVLRLCECFPHEPPPGTLVVFRHYNRHCPAIHLNESRDTVLESVTLHQAGGMGVIAQFCESVALHACTVTPSEGRIFSVCADATHFVNCRGLIQMRDCLFENQLDDPSNVHGLNTRIHEVLDPYTVITERVHHEQHGVQIGFPGDRVNLSDNRTLLAYAGAEIQRVEQINARFARIVFKHPLPGRVEPGHVVENMSWTPDLQVSGCTVRNNRARGFLISTPGTVQIEKNRISASGAGIKISGDANYWFESGAVRDVLIRENEFGECCYGAPPWGCTAIDIDPEIAEPENNPACFHRNIRIEGNRFATSDQGILFARSVDGLVFRGNSVQTTGFYPPIGRMPQAVTLQACRNVVLENNEGLETGTTTPSLTESAQS